MDEIQPCADSYAAEAAKTGDAQDKRRPGIVAESQQALTLLALTLPAAIQLACRPPTHRITADDAQKKGRAACAGHTE